MGIAEKFADLAALAKKLPADLEALGDKAKARMTDLDARGVAALTKIHSTLDDVEAGVRATEDMANQLSNGSAPK